MPPIRAVIFMGLNGIRILSIVSLLLVIASNILVMVTNIKAVNHFEANKGNMTDLLDCEYIEGSTVPNQPAGVFWAVVASLLIVIQSIILLLSEVSWPIKFFDRFFPVLGSDFGLGPLGIFQGLIATQILSHHVDDFTLVSAFFLFSLGCLNMFLGLVFRESAKSKRSITSWRADTKDILPKTNPNDIPKRTMLTPNNHPSPLFISRSLSSANDVDEKPGYLRYYQNKPELKSDFGSFKSTDKAGYGFGRQGEKAAGLRGFMLQKPEESLPRYAPPPSANRGSVARSESSRSSSSSFSSPYRKSKDSEAKHSKSRSRSDRSHSHSRSGSSRDHSRERTGTPVPTFRSSPTAI
ncbi:hypothetical protein AMATHDRAFT_58508 [Amanita thiersii Skay4041]|uniref:DUF7598 domain-containing protein n=1 Tax=Amanita thiersii Skay4041 TaxID=703135 RepID=A0A2A9NNM7_9AGAR|nr:hypothetical protein AMATHDRAFT_58508 [Amanita thiersii Skay4041]